MNCVQRSKELMYIHVKREMSVWAMQAGEDVVPSGGASRHSQASPNWSGY